MILCVTAALSIVRLTLSVIILGSVLYVFLILFTGGFLGSFRIVLPFLVRVIISVSSQPYENVFILVDIVDLKL
jgi:hypothetical protein